MSNRSDQQAERVVVIGGGLAGLASACTLAARGYAVTVFDKNGWFGGKAAVLAAEGFRFDMGPTILTMPKVLRRIFGEAGRNLDDAMQLVRLDPQWRCFFDEDGDGLSVLDLREHVDEMKKTLAAFGNGEGAQLAEGYEQFVRYAENLHRISERFYFWKPIGGLADMFDARTAMDVSTLKDVMSMRMGRSVASTIRKYVHDERAAQMLDHFTQYVGSSPFGSPAILCGIASMQVNEGVWYPIGGTRAVPEALVELATQLGVEFRAGQGVKKIHTEVDRVTAVETDDGAVTPCAAVVSNMDSVRTHRELLDPHVARKFDTRRQYEPACSGVVLYLGLKERYEHLAHHDFVFSRNAEEEFDHIYQRGEPAPDPTCYLAAPAATEPEVAPPGGEALYVLVHTPFLRPHHDWDRMFPPYREVILDKLERAAGLTGIRDRIVFEDKLTPTDIHTRYHVLNGAIYGLASHGKYMGAFKPSNRSPDVSGLYLAGGAAHPGPGMPMVLMSGWIAADTLDRDGRVAKTREAASA